MKEASTISRPEFVDYLREQAQYIYDIADDIENGGDDSLALIHLDLDLLNDYLNLSTEIED